MIIKPFIRDAYNYDRDLVSDETGLMCLDDSRTKQSFAEECDINTIVRRFNLTGQLPSNVRAPTYGDFEEVFDYHSAMNAILEAERSFMMMPAEVRDRFGNDPQRFLEFVNDDHNRDEAVKLGLVLPQAAQLASEAPPASGAAGAPSGFTAGDAKT